MGYCFMSIEKIKSKGTMERKYEHNYRTGYVPNADPEKTHLNDELVKLNGKTYSEAFDERIDSLDYYKESSDKKAPKIRKDAIRALEIVLTFSREDLDNINIEEWKKNNVEWLRQTFNANPDKYGDNVLSVQYHGDEAGNVHIHAFVVPIDDKGKLNASYYIDGRQKMIELQNSYGKTMKEKHGLNRGLQGSFAKHQDIRHFYASLNAEIKKEVPKPEKNESIEDYSNRIQEEFRILNERYLALELKYQRKYDEFKTMSINEKIELAKAKEELEQYQGIIDKFGSLEFAKNRLETILSLNTGIRDYPDRDYAMKANEMIKTILEFEENKIHDKDIEK